MIDVIVFDWDGTLVDSTGLISQAILAAAEDIGVAVPDRAQASHVIGLGLAQALARVVPDLPPDKIGAFAARYHAHYLAGEDNIRLFPGVPEVLTALRQKGFRLAIATGKTDRGLQRALQATGLRPLFDATRCADQTHPKPHPAMLLELAEALNVRCARMRMVGDTSHDLEMAQAAGVPAVGVCFGAHSREHLSGFAAQALFDTPAALHEWLLLQSPAD
jgi:phosphoglycolate phosphatase